MKKNIRKLVLALLTAALSVSLAGMAFAADTGLLQSFKKMLEARPMEIISRHRYWAMRRIS